MKHLVKSNSQRKPAPLSELPLFAWAETRARDPLSPGGPWISQRKGIPPRVADAHAEANGFGIRETNRSRPSANIEAPTTPANQSEAPETGKTLCAAPRGLPVKTDREENDDYPRVVVVLNHRWRVIEGSCGIQWVLQYRNGRRRDRPIWRSRRFCRTLSGLLASIRELCGVVDAAALKCLAALPARFPEVADA